MSGSRISVSITLLIQLMILSSSITRHLISASSADVIVNPSKSSQISSKPRAYVYKGFLTYEECDHLISLAKLELKRSAIADHLSGKSTLSEVRTSSGMFITKGKVFLHFFSFFPKKQNDS